MDLVRSLGADHVVPHCDDFADHVRAVVPDGADGLADGAVQSEKVVAAVKDGGVIGTVRGWGGPAVRDIRVLPVLVFDHAERTDLLDRLSDQAEDGTLTLRVAQVFAAEKAAEAHRLLDDDLRRRLAAAQLGRGEAQHGALDCA